MRLSSSHYRIATRQFKRCLSFAHAGASSAHVYRGTLVNPINLKRVEIAENAHIGVSEKGVIEFVARDEGELRAAAAQHAQYFEGGSGGGSDSGGAPRVASHRLIDLNGAFLMPGLVDTHNHAPQYVNAGTGTDLPLLQWLEKYTFPAETRFEDSVHAQQVYTRAVGASLRAGTTTCCYFATIHLQSTQVLANVVAHLGQRALIGKVCMDRNCPDTYRERTADSLAAARDCVQYVRALNERVDAAAAVSVGEAPLVQPVITPRFAPTSTDELLSGLGKLARDEGDVFIQSHVSENVDEVAWVRELFPNSANYTDVYDAHGLLTRRTVMAHGVYLGDDELDAFARTGASVSHCASSNFTLRSGVLDARRVLKRGVKLGLGTDVSGGYSPSMFDAIRQTIIASTVSDWTRKSKSNATAAAAAAAADADADTANDSAAPLSYEEAFCLATLGGAQALDLAEHCGSLDVGKQFDALVIDPHVTPIDTFESDSTADLFQKVVYRADDRNIRHVYVAGKRVVDNDRK